MCYNSSIARISSFAYNAQERISSFAYNAQERISSFAYNAQERISSFAYNAQERISSFAYNAQERISSFAYNTYMNYPNSRIIPVSEARARLSDLVDKASGDNYFLLTRGGKPEVALVDAKYLEKLERDLAKIYQKTYIDPQLLPLTREFSNKEIKQWQEEDQI